MSESRLFVLFTCVLLLVSFGAGIGARMLGAGDEGTASALLLSGTLMMLLGSYLYTKYVLPRDRRR